MNRHSKRKRARKLMNAAYYAPTEDRMFAFYNAAARIDIETWAG